MREKEIERRLVNAVRGMGGICPKFTSPGMNGMPDRIVLLPEGRIGFVELKAPGKKPRPVQKHRLRQLHGLGFYAAVVDGEDQIEGVLDAIEGGDA